MRRACRKICQTVSVPCTSRKSLRTELSTINEEPESCEEDLTPPRHVLMSKKQGKREMFSTPRQPEAVLCSSILISLFIGLAVSN
ncbi:hypothetical protein L6164_034893 [Bauhinia variegata]|uniref:Uncharacterized protein n=1 Tax=Bauhinia variegata TaxID=167791 RepID=A0ACB9KXL3_BAUVA|nr:hypothetical protein L6164_034893 [Bauhinia variegata]